MDFLALLVLVFSVFCLGYGLWLGYWDLYPFGRDDAAVLTLRDEDLPFFERATLGPPVAWSLLLHAGIIAALLLLGDIPPGVRRFPSRDRMATPKDFYVFIASLPDEEKHSPKASHGDNLRSPLQAAIPTLPVPTATRVAGLTMASVGDSANGGPPTEKGAKKPRAPAPRGHDAASRELPTTPKRMVELFAVRALRPSAEHLEPAGPLPAFTQDAAVPLTHAPPSSQSTLKSTGTHLADLPAPKALPPSPIQHATQPSMPLTAEQASPFFPSPGTMVAGPDVTRAAPRAPAPKSAGVQQQTKLAKLRALKTLPPSPIQDATPRAPLLKVSPSTPEGEPVSNRVPMTGPSPHEPEEVSARSPSEPPATSQEALLADEQTQETLPPATPMQDATPRAERGLSTETDLPEAEETPLARFGDASPAPEVAPQPPEKPVPDGLGVAAQPVEAGPAPFPSLGTVVGAQPATPSSPDRAVLPRGPDPEPDDPGRVLASVPPTPEPPAVGQAADSAERKALPPSPIQHATQPSMPQGAPPAGVVKPLPEPAVTGADPVGLPPPGTLMAASGASHRIPPGSPAGRGFGRLTVRLDGPRSRVTNHEIETVSGKILGGVPVQLALYVNGTAAEVVDDDGSFEASVSLRRGLNHLRAVAKDWRGIETDDTIAVKYVPPPVPNGIAITSPPDGHTLPPDTPPAILVEGQVEDWDVSTLWLVANNRRIAVYAHNGRFRKALPLLEPVLHMWAELPPNGGPPHRSRTVTVRAPSSSRSHALLLLEWPEGVVGHQVEVEATWRASPERLDVPIRSVPMKVFGSPPKDSLPEIFSLRMKPGVYTFVLRARGMSASGVRATLVLPEGGHLEGQPVSLNGTREVVLAKVLLPQGVLWGDDGWFTGQSESADSVTKFRFPEGISWTERKKDLP